MSRATEFADLKRVGVIDVGSNSVRLVVFDGAARSPAYFYNEKVLCGLGRGISETGRLHREGSERALRAMVRFAALAESFAVQSMTVVATAAVRDASDGPDFCARVLALTGLEITIASGLHEARFAAQGVLLGWPTAEGLVSDIGGASMELAEVSAGQVGTCISSPLAPLRLADVEGDVDAYIHDTLVGLRTGMPGEYPNLYLVGGSYRAIARLDMARRNYPLEVLHEYELNRAQLRETLDWVDTAGPEELRKLSGMSMARMSLVPMAAKVLRRLVEVFDPGQAAISGYGLREGLLYEQMPDELRKRDPLIEACASMERNSARYPGFGAVLARWVAPLLPKTDAWRRIVMAAALLHDVSWRSDPGSRAEECFDNASRANLGGLDHSGRVLLAMALLHRYRKSARNGKYKAMQSLLNEEQRRGAQVIGQAMRLGASLAGGDARILAGAGLHLTKARLELRLQSDVTRFGGEIVAMRLAELAASMNREAVLTEL